MSYLKDFKFIIAMFVGLSAIRGECLEQIIMQSTLPADRKLCNEKVLYSKGLFKKYEMKYTAGEGGTSTSKTSEKEGSLKVSANSSGQSVTSTFDPGVWIGSSTSTTQSSSSFGECSSIRNTSLWNQREEYIAENYLVLQNEISKGQGESIDVITFLSGCPPEVKIQFSNLMHENYNSLFDQKQGWEFSPEVDRLLDSHHVLDKACASKRGRG